MAIDQIKPKVSFWLLGENLEQIIDLVREGKTNKEIYEELGISRATFSRILNEKPVYDDIFDAPYNENFENFENVAKLIAYVRTGEKKRIRKSLAACATGYYYYDEFVNKKGEKVRTKRWMPPSVEAIKIQLEAFDEDYRKRIKEEPKKDISHITSFLDGMKQYINEVEDEGDGNN